MRSSSELCENVRKGDLEQVMMLLECGCPLKRLRDTVDAMRLLANPAAEYARLRHCGSGAKLRLVWNTAEASGCELEPPTPVVDWAHGGSMGVSRY